MTSVFTLNDPRFAHLGLAETTAVEMTEARYCVLGAMREGISYILIEGTRDGQCQRYLYATEDALISMAWKKCWTWFLALRRSELRLMRQRGLPVLACCDGQLAWDMVDRCYQVQGGPTWLALPGHRPARQPDGAFLVRIP